MHKTPISGYGYTVPCPTCGVRDRQALVDEIERLGSMLRTIFQANIRSLPDKHLELQEAITLAERGSMATNNGEE